MRGLFPDKSLASAFKLLEFLREGCHKYGIKREYENETGGSQLDARSKEGCDSTCRIRVRAI